MREAKHEKSSSWSISFQGWFGTTFVVKLNTLWIGAPLQRLQNYLGGKAQVPLALV
jgi:hypothetical protein